MARYVVNPPEPNEVIVNLAGAQGPKGDDGTSIIIKGNFDTPAELPMVPVNPTDAYIVGSDLYIWTGSEWHNAGPFRGPKGDPGTPGTPGAPGSPGSPGTSATIAVGATTSVAPNMPATVTNEGTSTNAVLAFAIPKGDKGEPGTNGVDGNSGAYHQTAAGQPYIQGEGQIYIGVEFPTNFPDGSLFFRKI